MPQYLINKVCLNTRLPPTRTLSPFHIQNRSLSSWCTYFYDTHANSDTQTRDETRQHMLVRPLRIDGGLHRPDRDVGAEDVIPDIQERAQVARIDAVVRIVVR